MQKWVFIVLKEIYSQKGVWWRYWTEFGSILPELHLISCSSRASLQAVIPCAITHNHTWFIRSRVEKYRQDWPGRNLPNCDLQWGKRERRRRWRLLRAKWSEHLHHWDVELVFRAKQNFYNMSTSSLMHWLTDYLRNTRASRQMHITFISQACKKVFSPSYTASKLNKRGVEGGTSWEWDLW